MALPAGDLDAGRFYSHIVGYSYTTVKAAAGMAFLAACGHRGTKHRVCCRRMVDLDRSMATGASGNDWQNARPGYFTGIQRIGRVMAAYALAVVVVRALNKRNARAVNSFCMTGETHCVDGI